MQSPTSSEQNTKDHPDLFKRSVKGGFWVFVLRILTQLVSYARWIVLARILELEEMGLLFIGTLTIQTLTTFTNTGFQTALIQKKEGIEKYLNTTWAIGIIRAVLIYLILFFVAPYVSKLRVPADKVVLTISLIRVIGLSLLINAFANIAIIHFVKELKFYKKFVFEISGTLVDAVVTITIALCYKTVWALVYGKLAGSVVRMILSYIIFSYRPAFSLDIVHAKDLWGFGKWMFVTSIMYFVMGQGDDIFVWAYLGVVNLTLYRMAYTLCDVPFNEIAATVGQVAFPAYSKLQNDLPRLKDGFLKVLQLTMAVACPLIGLIFILAPEFVSLFLTEKYAGAIRPMQVLAILGTFKTIKAASGPVFYAVGKPKILTKIYFVKLIVFLVSLYPMTRMWGITGTAITMLLISAFSFPFEMYYLNKTIDCRVTTFFGKIVPTAFSMLVLVAVIELLKRLVFVDIGFVTFFVLAIIGLSAYVITIYLADVIFKLGLRAIIFEQINVFMKSKVVVSELDAENAYDETIN